MTRPEPTGKTILKIRVGRRTREYVSAVKLLLGLGCVIGAIFLAQVGICKYHHPKRGVMECVKPWPAK